ncbi:hypothetical protein ACS5PK_22530 [Roseateles sp. DB2]|uniref:hypothetical protein n=1 Tax=Roseateles sp. DB2 TaxID=3453717 RepID=UPI003EED28E1
MSVDRMPLRQEHVSLVQSLIETNPGVSLWKLTALVAHRCKVPTLSYPTLRRFMQLHSIVLPEPVRRPPAGKRITARSAQAEAEERGIVLEVPVTGSQVYRLLDRPAKAHKARSSRSLPPPPQTPFFIEQRRLMAIQNASQWITRHQLQAAAAAALAAATHHMHRDIDDEDYDPKNPQAWFRGFEFAEDVVDLFRLAVYRLAADAGIDGAADEVRRLGALGGAERLQELMS